MLKTLLYHRRLVLNKKNSLYRNYRSKSSNAPRRMTKKDKADEVCVDDNFKSMNIDKSNQISQQKQI